MMLLSVISQLDLAMGISRLLPQVRDRRWRPVLGTYVAATAAEVSAAVRAKVATSRGRSRETETERVTAPQPCAGGTSL